MTVEVTRIGEAQRPVAATQSMTSSLRREAERAAWQVNFLLAEFPYAETNVERGVILEWLEAAKQRREQFEAALQGDGQAEACA